MKPYSLFPVAFGVCLSVFSLAQMVGCGQTSDSTNSGAAASGGASVVGGAANSGGAISGGGTSGGGAVSGGASSARGGAVSGGANSGGASSARGGAVSGGGNSGGTSASGASAGGATSSGGANWGGATSGGGASSGGTLSSGGSANGGSSGAGPSMAAVQAIFDQRCVTCHDATKTEIPSYPALPLTSDAAYAALVSHAADETCGGTRVVPFDSSKSYLYRKVADATPCDGVRMPRKPEVGISVALTASELETVRAWIDGGAHR